MNRTWRAALIVTFGALCGSASAQMHEIPPDLWDRPRTGRAVAAQESVKRAVTALIAQPDARLLIRHPSGQESVLQAEELRSWLGALAIDTRRIALRSDLAPGSPLQIEVVP